MGTDRQWDRLARSELAVPIDAGAPFRARNEIGCGGVAYKAGSLRTDRRLGRLARSELAVPMAAGVPFRGRDADGAGTGAAFLVGRAVERLAGRAGPVDTGRPDRCKGAIPCTEWGRRWEWAA